MWNTAGGHHKLHIYILVNESADLSRAMVLWHGREGISEVAGEHSGRQFESCIKFIATTTLPFEIGINSSHQPTNSSTSDFTQLSTYQPTQHSNQPNTSMELKTPTIHSGIITPNVLSTSFRSAPKAEQENSNALSHSELPVYQLFGWVRHILYSYIFLFIFMFFFFS